MISVLNIALTSLLVTNIAVAADNICVPQTTEYGIVCVCNATYCDTAGSLPDLAEGEYAIITSSESGQRFNVTKGNTTLSQIPHYRLDELVLGLAYTLSTLPTLTYLSVDPRITYQQVEGFGGTFTDTSGMNILNISSDAQEYLLRSYFGADGLDYNLGRLPIGGNDFSPRAYAYNEYPINDTNLSNFTLTEEDYTLKIPLILRAKELASDEIQLHAVTWSPPAWMKTNNALYGYSELKPEYYYTYALYHLKFLQEYNKENITVYGLSNGNEPVISSFGDIVSVNSLGWDTRKLAQWIINDFGPTIKESDFSDTKIYLLDEQTPFVYDMLPILLEDDAILKYIDGIAFHYYVDYKINITEAMDKVYELLGNTSIINTEASIGTVPKDPGVKLGSWMRGIEYLYYVIQKMNNNLNGWLDWNLAVNMAGGPAWNNSTLDAFIAVDADNDQFFKTPMYYAFGHMSKYVPRGSRRIASHFVNEIPCSSFVRPDGLIAIVAMNNGTVAQTVSLDDYSTGQFIKFDMEANSISTIVYNPKNMLVTNDTA